MNYPELPLRYAQKVEADPSLAILYSTLEGRVRPIQLYRDCVEMIRRGLVIDLNTGIEEMKYAHYRYRDGQHNKMPIYFGVKVNA